MAESEISVPPPDENPFEVATAPSRKGRRYFLWGCLSLVLLLLFVVLGLSLLMSYGKKSALPVVERFLVAIEAEDYAGAYEQIGAEWRQSADFESFKSFFKRINQTLGRHDSLSMEAFRIDVKGGESTATAGFAVKYPTGPAFLTVNLKWVGEDWRINMMKFNSNLLVTQMRCPNCGKLVSISAKFCSQCGTPLTSAPKDAAPVEKETPPSAGPPEG